MIKVLVILAELVHKKSVVRFMERGSFSRIPSALTFAQLDTVSLPADTDDVALLAFTRFPNQSASSTDKTRGRYKSER